MALVIFGGVACDNDSGGGGGSRHRPRPLKLGSSLNILVSPETSTVNVTGPNGFNHTAAGSRIIKNLAPGLYQVNVTAPGYTSQSVSVDLGLDESKSMLLLLEPQSITSSSLNILVNPESSTVSVTGPNGYSFNAAGSRTLRDLVPGIYQVSANATGFTGQSISVDLGANESKNVVMLLETASITGTSLNILVNPESSTVSITGPNGYNYTNTGSRTLSNLAPGLYQVNATAPGYTGQSISVDLSADESKNVVMILEAGSISGTSLNILVNPESSNVSITGPNGYSYTGTGSRTLRDLAPGLYQVNATATGYTGQSISVDLGANESKNVVMLLEVRPLTTGSSLNITVTPASSSVKVTGPNSYVNIGDGSQNLDGLDPGIYQINVSAPGYSDKSRSVSLGADDSIDVDISLNALPIITGAPRVVYRDGNGNLVTLTDNDMQFGEFVFYAWLQDLPAGITPASLETSLPPIAAEQEEVAPSDTQNLAVSWVGFVDPSGVVRPLIGADVRWEIDQWYALRTGSMQFGTSDDYGIATGLGVFDDQANTRTNNASLANLRFPFAADYPLFNQTGIMTPNVNGITWVTLFSPDTIADGRIVAVATVNGVEIGKEILIKHFAPQPIIRITKTVAPASINLDVLNNVTFTVTVTNVGTGDATSVNLHDIFNGLVSTGLAANYSLSGLPAGAVPIGDDGFDYTFPLAVGASVNLTFTATVTEVGRYCNDSTIINFSGLYKTETPVDLSARACFIANRSDLSIIKDFVDANNNSLGPEVTTAANVAARLRIRVLNIGGADATNVNLADLLTAGTLSNYTFTGLVGGGVPNAMGGFDYIIPTIAANGGTATFYYSVSASADGTYCDTATVTPPNVSDSACLTVETAILQITKSNLPGTVLPGGHYTSTIVVTNIGNAIAKNVRISDLLGLNTITNTWAIYVSSSLSGVSGTLASNVVTAGSLIDIPPAGSRTFTVVSSIPGGAIAGTYCDYGKFVSDNAGNGQAEACVVVPAYVAVQTQLVDTDDPIMSDVIYFSVLFNESRSNEAADNHALTYSFGLTNPASVGIPGVFQVTSTRIYKDANPIQDPITGLVVSDATNPTATLLTLGVDYTLTTTLGFQTITFNPGIVLQRGQAFYLYHAAIAPLGTPTGMYTTGYIWDFIGVTSNMVYQASSSEATTVIQ